MTRRNSFGRLNVETLEERRVCSITMFDANLTAVVQPGTNGGKDHIVVDGSQYDDTVEITFFSAVSSNVVIHLKKGVGGTPDSEQTLTLHSTNLDPFQPIQVYGKQGNDTIINNTALGMYVDAGTGDDYASGGSGKDNIYGGDGRDTLMGRKGTDYLQGDAGNDYLRGGDSDDTIIGNDGDDIMYGEGGNDYLYGGAGDDLMFGDVEDAVRGGNDYMHGDAGNDTMWGSGGIDTMIGDDGNDLMYGGNGRDSMFGNLGSDSLYGGGSADYLDGGTDDPDFSGDLLVGGRGADTFVHHHHVFGGDDADVFFDFDASHGDREDDKWHL